MTRLSIGLLVLALMGGPALADSAKPGFESLDMNRDGSVSLAEFATLYPTDSATSFEYLDRDRNGELSVDEYALMPTRLTVANR
jgi:hypothetical protein